MSHNDSKQARIMVFSSPITVKLAEKESNNGPQNVGQKLIASVVWLVCKSSLSPSPSLPIPVSCLSFKVVVIAVVFVFVVVVLCMEKLLKPLIWQ